MSVFFLDSFSSFSPFLYFLFVFEHSQEVHGESRQVLPGLLDFLPIRADHSCPLGRHSMKEDALPMHMPEKRALGADLL